MWQEAGQLAAELLIRDKAPDQERIFDGRDRSRLRVPFGAQDSFKSRLNLSGWLDDEVEEVADADWLLVLGAAGGGRRSVDGRSTGNGAERKSSEDGDELHDE